MPSRAALKMHDEIQEKKDEENNIFTGWRDLIIGHAYKILDVNRIKTVHGKASFFTLKKDNKSDKFNAYVDMMKRESRDEFVNWYHHQVTTHAVFDFRKEIMEYCRSDVDILRRCCLKFRTLFRKECGLDPFLHSFTIAAACNKVYRHRFLKPNTIGIVPPGGYRVKIRQSNMAFK